MRQSINLRFTYLVMSVGASKIFNLSFGFLVHNTWNWYIVFWIIFHVFSTAVHGKSHTVAKVYLIPVLVGIFCVFVFCGLMRSCLSNDSFVPDDDCLRLTPEPENGLHTKVELLVSVSCYFFTLHVCEHNIQCESKNPPLRLSDFFHFFTNG